MSSSRQKIIDHVSCLDNFVIGNIRGGWYPHGTGAAIGLLPAELAQALNGVDGPVYVVHSYETPIAWHPASGVNVWEVPDVRYSTTTSGHQNLVKQAITVRSERINQALTEVWISTD